MAHPCILCHSLKFKKSCKILGSAIAQIIDYMSSKHHMRFTIVSNKTNNLTLDIANEIIRQSQSVVNIENLDDSKMVEKVSDFDEAYVALLDSHRFRFNDSIKTTKRVTYRRTMILVFDLRYSTYNSRLGFGKSFMNNKFYQVVPHDLYRLAHSSTSGTVWLMANEMFFNQTCKSYYHPINVFNSSKLSWNTTKFMNSYHKFHNCKIAVTEEFFTKIKPKYYDEQTNKTLDYIYAFLGEFAAKHRIRFYQGNAEFWFKTIESYFKAKKESVLFKRNM